MIIPKYLSIFRRVEREDGSGEIPMLKIVSVLFRPHTRCERRSLAVEIINCTIDQK